MSQINSVYSHNQGVFTHSSEPGSSGKIMGRDASLIREARSLLQDAAEELSFTLDRSQDAALRARQEKGKKNRFSEAKEYYDLLAQEGESPEDQAAKETFFDNFLRKEPDSDSILKEAMRHWEYPEEAWANLNQAYERMQGQGANKEALADLADATYLLERRYGGAIRAGLSGAFVRDSQLLLSARERGQEYREAVFQSGSTFDLYQSLIKNHENDFSKAIDFLEKALALDLAAATPSKDREALHTFGQGLSRLQLLRSADERLKQLETPSLSHSALLGKVLNLGNSAFPSGSDCVLIAELAGQSELVQRILFLQKLLTCLRAFPPRLFDTDDGRMKAIDATQEAVDKAVEEEDQLYE